MQIVKSLRKISAPKIQSRFFFVTALSCYSVSFSSCISATYWRIGFLSFFSGFRKKSHGERYGCHETQGTRVSVSCQSSIKCSTAGVSDTSKQGHTRQPPKTRLLARLPVRCNQKSLTLFNRY